jgi:hypothetical protein
MQEIISRLRPRRYAEPPLRRNVSLTTELVVPFNDEAMQRFNGYNDALRTDIDSLKGSSVYCHTTLVAMRGLILDLGFVESTLQLVHDTLQNGIPVRINQAENAGGAIIQLAPDNQYEDREYDVTRVLLDIIDPEAPDSNQERPLRTAIWRALRNGQIITLKPEQPTPPSPVVTSS